MEPDRLGIKFYLKEPQPAVADLTSFLHAVVPVFHKWIQKQSLEGHLLIDVHDYSHIFNGPGILLVGHESNISLDLADGRPGLLYYRKQPQEGSEVSRVVAILRAALQACELLAADPVFEGRIRFAKDEALMISNDRLNAPNDEETFLKLTPALEKALKEVLPEAEFVFERVSSNPRERLAIQFKDFDSAS